MKYIKSAVFIVLCFVIFFSLQRLFMPKYMSGIYEGALVAEYYTEPKIHDVIFLGDCEVYSNVSPITLWTDYGISSYIRGGPQQLIWQSYYLLEDILRYEKPSVVVFSVLAMQYDEPQREGYNRLNIDGMRLSSSKIASARKSLTDGESLLSYVIPLFRYHDRWAELMADDFRYFFRRDKVSINGYMMRADVEPVGFMPDGRRLADYNFGENSYKYLDMITDLCKENGIELILFKAPSLYPYWYDEWDEQMTSYAEANRLLYINSLELLDEIGIDFSEDTYNGGFHLNVYGAEKMAGYFGEILKHYAPNRHHESKYSSAWHEKVLLYNRIKEAQELEFKELGSVSLFRFRGDIE
jgi:hypothetical protein